MKLLDLMLLATKIQPHSSICETEIDQEELFTNCISEILSESQCRILMLSGLIFKVREAGVFAVSRILS